jgi:hypothetical protein
MDKKAILLVWLILCHVGNYADLGLTMYALANGVQESNPIMAWLYQISPFLFGSIKLLVFSLAIEFIARRMPAALRWIAMAYMLVTAWHLSFVFLL